jgi:hypothetical protein
MTGIAEDGARWYIERREAEPEAQIVGLRRRRWWVV